MATAAIVNNTQAERPKASMRRSLVDDLLTFGSGSLCSTPEGIDAAITQRRMARGMAGLRCSTPEGIDAAITFRIKLAMNCLFCAQRPKASMRRSRPTVYSQPYLLDVLNARRHRCGDHMRSVKLVCAGCRAQRPKASMRRSHQCAPRQASRYFVLNARRHRCGDHQLADLLGYELGCVLNARRHRCGDHFEAEIEKQRKPCAQRPKASMRRSPRFSTVAPSVGRVLNARRHRCGDHVSRCFASFSVRRCSTPEGIDAAITCQRPSLARRCCARAQRPKASMRRSPNESVEPTGL